MVVAAITAATLLIKLATAPNVALQPATTVEKRVMLAVNATNLRRRSPAIAAARPATSLATALMLLDLGAAVLAAVPEATLAAVEVRNATNVEKSVTSLVTALKVAMAVEVIIKEAMVVDMEAAAVAPARLVTPVVAMDTCPVIALKARNATTVERSDTSHGIARQTRQQSVSATSASNPATSNRFARTSIACS